MVEMDVEENRELRFHPSRNEVTCHARGALAKQQPAWRRGLWSRARDGASSLKAKPSLDQASMRPRELRRIIVVPKTTPAPQVRPKTPHHHRLRAV